MKKLIFNSRYIFFFLGLFLISLSIYSQDASLSRKEKKEARKAEEFAFFHYLDTLMSHKSFVLEADYLENQYGQRAIVTPTLNFILVDSINAVLQTGSNVFLGHNGVGGVTAEGSVNRWEITKNDKNLSYNLRFGISTNIGFYDVMMTITSGNYARATITGIAPGRLTYTGHIRSLYDSRVFKGQNTI